MFELERMKLGKTIISEHGEGYQRNVNVRGCVLKLGDDFLIYHLEKVNGIKCGIIDYMFFTSSDGLELFAMMCNIFCSECVRYVYFKEHKKVGNYAELFLKEIGLSVKERHNYDKWKHKWTSSNGFPENEIIEAFTD
jgi:hypothetical protein